MTRRGLLWLGLLIGALGQQVCSCDSASEDSSPFGGTTTTPTTTAGAGGQGLAAGGGAGGQTTAGGQGGTGGTAGAGGDGGGPIECPDPTLAPGDYDGLTITFDGRERTYNLHVPPGYDGTSPLPLVFNLHGYLSTPRQQQMISGLNAVADRESFFAVHPAGYRQSWNAGVCCGAAAAEDLDDVGLFRALIVEIALQVCVDPHRVYAMGESNGGFMSHRLACEAADAIAAVGPVAGVLGIPEAECLPARPIAVIHTHGTNDLLVPYDGRPGGGGFGGYPGAPETMAGWAARDGCTTGPTETFRDGAFHCDTWGSCAAGVEVMLCTVDGAGHIWPGGALTTNTIWSFFARFPRP